MSRARMWAALGGTVLALAVVTARARPIATCDASIPQRLDPAVQFVRTLPAYVPDRQVSGTLRVWGHGGLRRAFMAQLLACWSAGFKRVQVEAEFDDRMYGTASAIGALYTGAGDLAILGEEIQPEMTAAFERARGYPPYQVEVATGSLDVRNFDYAHVFYVHASNPLSRVTLAELDAIFGEERRRHHPHPIRTWDDLGVGGDWAGHSVQPYGWRLDDDFARYLEAALLGGSHHWNNTIREFGHLTRPDGSIYDHGQQILDALARDRYGMAVSNPRYANELVKPLTIARGAGDPAYAATRDNLIERRYPLTRIVPAFVDRVPGHPIDPLVREFLRYVLSREGQLDIVREAGYLPLSADAIRAQRRRLE